MENNLTPQQRLAVENRGGKLLVSAAAGSGKTKVLVDRLMGYILDPVNPSNIDDFLMITYTKAAASELRGKIAAKLTEHLAEQPGNRHLQRQMQRLYLAKISTVHAFCTDLLREFAYELNLPGDFRMAEDNEGRELQEQAMEEVLEEAYASNQENPAFLAFVDSQGVGRNDRKVSEIVFKTYEAARCHLNPDQWLDSCVQSADVSGVEDAAQTVWGAYLMADLKDYLAMQIHAMEGSKKAAELDGAMPKVEALLEKNIALLNDLAGAATWDQVVERKKPDWGRMNFPKNADPDTKAQIQLIRDSCKKGMEKRLEAFADDSAQSLADLAQTSFTIQGLVDLTRAFSKRYADLKRRRRMLDFSDLEHKALDLLMGKKRSGPTKIAREVGQRFREVMVDEYQDTNSVQDAIFSALTQEKQNCFMVGDVKQSIYQFRLADPGIFLEKYRSYVDPDQAVAGQGRKVLLSQNFRSGASVLEGANDVFRRCMTERVGGLDYGDAEALREGIPHEPLGEPEVELTVLVTGESGYEQEAAFVARRVAELLDGTHMIRGKEGLRPVKPEDIAILLRAANATGTIYQDALAAKGIRASLGRGRDLLQTGEISLLRALLQIISNPRQDIPLLAVLASPVFGFTADDLARIRSGNKKGDFYDALLGDDTEQSKEFLAILEQLRKKSRTVTLAQLLEEIFCLTRLDSIYAAMDSGVERTANLREFYRLTMEFEAAARRDLTQFLNYLELLEHDGLKVENGETGGTVQITSIHKSKGLEYPVVFLPGLSRSFNAESQRAQVLIHGELGLGMPAVDHATRTRYPTVAKRAIAAQIGRESLSEELRVLYVAMTRARDRLIMTYASKSPEKELGKYARCMDLVGPELLASGVSCPGQWVLMEAMCRTEAGALFALAQAQPDCIRSSAYPWRIQVADLPDPAQTPTPAQGQIKIGLPEGMAEQLKARLDFHYAHTAATKTPSKQTATQLKGREKDAEAAEQAKPVRQSRTWRALDGVRRGGKEYGTAIHALMQFVRFEACASPEGLEAEIQRIAQRGLISPEQARTADRAGILAFFQTELGRKMIHGQVLREFKFSILDDAGKYGEGLDGEQILLQGVVDCALVEPEGITIVDFKTDFVTDETVEAVCARYSSQVAIYAEALRRIYETPVKHKYLYLFHLRKLVEI